MIKLSDIKLWVLGQISDSQFATILAGNEPEINCGLVYTYIPRNICNSLANIQRARLDYTLLEHTCIVLTTLGLEINYEK